MEKVLSAKLMRAPQTLARRISVARYRRLASGSATALLASYPKSGRTWVRFMLANYFTASRANEQVTMHSMFALAPNFDLDPVRGVPAFIERAEARAIPLVPSTHLPFSSNLPRDLPIVFLIRDPRAVLNSAYYHATLHKRTFSGSLEQFLENERQGLPHYIDYMNSWGRGLSRGRNHVMYYEDIVEDPEDEVAGLLDFLGEPVDRAAVRHAAEASAFDRLQEMERKEGVPGHEYDKGDANALRMRKGRTDSFREEMTPDQQSMIERTCDAQLHPAMKVHLHRYGFITCPAASETGADRLARGTLAAGDGNLTGRLAPLVQMASEVAVIVGLTAMLLAPAILAIEVGEWLLSREWDGSSLEDGLGLFGIDRPGPVETPAERVLDVLLALPLTFALFLAGLALLLTGVRNGDWGVHGLRLQKKLSLRKSSAALRRKPQAAGNRKEKSGPVRERAPPAGPLPAPSQD